MVVVELAASSIRSGPVMSMGGLEVALMRTDTGSSSPLVTVTENGPELLERMTRRGPDTVIESSCCRTHPVVLTVATRDAHGVLAGGVRQVAQAVGADPGREVVLDADHALEVVAPPRSGRRTR